jgi:hypothetical protein
MSGPNFRITVGLENLVRRDFPLATLAQLNPLNANPVVDGEWLALNSAKALARGSSEGASSLVFPVHTEKGRYDTQGIGKANVIFAGPFEARSKVVDLTGLAVGDYLTVQDVTFEALTRRGLKKKSGTSGGIVIVGVCSKIIGTTEVEFIHTGKQVVF